MVIINGRCLPEMFCKKSVLKNFAKFHRKTSVLKSLFNKIPCLQACNFIKKRLQHSCFPVKFAKFLRTPILKNIGERPATLLRRDSNIAIFL